MPKSFACTRYGGMGLMLAGVVFAVGIFLHPDDTDPNFMFDSTWAVIHIGLGISLLLSMFGFIALLHQFTDRITFGANVMISTLIGSMALLSGLILFVEGFIFPALGTEERYSPALSMNGPLLSGDFGVAFTVVLALFSIAAIGTGYYLTTMKEFTSWAGWLLFAAPLIAFAPPVPQALFVAGGVIFGIGLIVIGKDLRKIG